MDEKSLIENAVKLSNGDETGRLEMKKESVDSLFNSPNVKSRELLYEESNRVAKEIDDSKKKEMGE